MASNIQRINNIKSSAILATEIYMAYNFGSRQQFSTEGGYAALGSQPLAHHRRIVYLGAKPGHIARVNFIDNKNKKVLFNY